MDGYLGCERKGRMFTIRFLPRVCTPSGVSDLIASVTFPNVPLEVYTFFNVWVGLCSSNVAEEQEES